MPGFEVSWRIQQNAAIQLTDDYSFLTATETKDLATEVVNLIALPTRVYDDLSEPSRVA